MRECRLGLEAHTACLHAHHLPSITTATARHTLTLLHTGIGTGKGIGIEIEREDHLEAGQLQGQGLMSTPTSHPTSMIVWSATSRTVDVVTERRSTRAAEHAVDLLQQRGGLTERGITVADRITTGNFLGNGHPRGDTMSAMCLVVTPCTTIVIFTAMGIVRPPHVRLLFQLTKRNPHGNTMIAICTQRTALSTIGDRRRGLVIGVLNSSTPDDTLSATKVPKNVPGQPQTCPTRHLALNRPDN